MAAAVTAGCVGWGLNKLPGHVKVFPTVIATGPHDTLILTKSHLEICVHANARSSSDPWKNSQM